MAVPAASYNPLIPQATDQLSGSQLDILNNFGALTTWLDQDHVDSAAAGAGKHFRVTLPVQNPAPTFTGTDVGFYNFLNATTALQEIYANKLVSGGGQSQIPITAGILSTNNSPASNTGGWTFLPSGLLLKFGNATGQTGTVTVTPTGGPAFTQMLSVIVCPFNAAAGDVDATVRLIAITSATQFQVYVSKRTTTGAATSGFQFLAIGY